MRDLYNENRDMQPVGRVLWEVEARAKGLGLMEARSNMHQDILKRAGKALPMGAARREAVHNAEELKEYQKFVRDSLIDSIGGLPSFDTPLGARITGTHKFDKYILENVIFESRPHTYVTANLYRPVKQDAPAPGVFIPLGHTDEGKGFDEYQRVAQMLSTAGFVVLTMDPIGEGERFEHYETCVEYEPIQGCSGEHDLLDWKCKLLGESVVRYFIHDAMRGIEYLKSRPEVIADKVAVTGHSGGGTQTSVLMTAASHMLAAAAPCSYTTSRGVMYEYGKDPDNEMTWPGVAEKGIDYADIMAGMCPKPVMILCNQFDFFPWEGTDETHDAIKKLWANVGADNVPGLTRVQTGHAYTYELAETITHFFAKHLMGHDVDISDFEYHRNEPDVLNCTKSGQIVKEFPDLVTTQDLLNRHEAELRARRQALPFEARKAAAEKWLRESVEHGRIPCEVHTRNNNWDGTVGHYGVHYLMWRPQGGYVNNGVLLRDLRYGDKPLPTVIALWENGTQAIERHSYWIHKQCAAGRQVLIVDLAAVASTEPNELSESGMYIGWGTFFILESALMDFGDSIAALRTYQAMQTLRVLRDLPLPEPTEYMFYGEGDFARYAKIAALLTKTPVMDNQEYQDYKEIVTEKYHDQTHTYDWIWPGILEACDSAELDEFLTADGLLLK